MINLDQQEVSAAAGAADFVEAMRVYANGGGGLCTQADVDDEATNQCTAVGDVKGNSVKGSGAIRTIQGFATSGTKKMSDETNRNTYRDYWGNAPQTQQYTTFVSLI